jgi:hypothetical protein
MIKSLPNANRGEIACRSIPTQILPELVSGRGTAAVGGGGGAFGA